MATPYERMAITRMATNILSFGVSAIGAWWFGAWGGALVLSFAAWLGQRKRASFVAAEVGALAGWVLVEPSWTRCLLVLVGSVVLVVLSSVRAPRGRALADDARSWGLGLGLFVAAAFEWASRRGAVTSASPGATAAVAWLILCAWFVAVSLGLVTEGFTSQVSGPPSLRAAAARGGVARNAAAAALATAADFALFHALLRVAPPGMATLGGCALGSVVNFSINRNWAFDSRGPLTAVAWRYAWVSGASAAVNAAAVSLALLEPSVTPSVAWLVARTLGFLAWNYPMQRDHVFGHRA